MHFAEFTEGKLFMQPGDERHTSQYIVAGGPVSSQELVRQSSTIMPIPPREPFNLGLEDFRSNQ